MAEQSSMDVVNGKGSEQRTRELMGHEYLNALNKRVIEECARRAGIDMEQLSGSFADPQGFAIEGSIYEEEMSDGLETAAPAPSVAEERDEELLTRRSGQGGCAAGGTGGSRRASTSSVAPAEGGAGFARGTASASCQGGDGEAGTGAGGGDLVLPQQWSEALKAALREAALSPTAAGGVVVGEVGTTGAATSNAEPWGVCRVGSSCDSTARGGAGSVRAMNAVAGGSSLSTP
ncbi:unnamed protein product, partial [Scytosiphon promiscuus]